jgi:hypothetical protein
VEAGRPALEALALTPLQIQLVTHSSQAVYPVVFFRNLLYFSLPCDIQLGQSARVKQTRRMR